MSRSLAVLLFLLACNSYVPPPAPPPDAGLVDSSAQAWTYCNYHLLGDTACGADHEVINCGLFKYNGTFYYVWTTNGDDCQ